MITDPRHAVWNRNACQPGAAVERIINDARHAVGNRNACQPGATSERTTADVRHAVWNRNACQPGAVAERIITDARYAVGNRNACQPGAAVERAITDSRHAIGNVRILTSGDQRIGCGFDDSVAVVSAVVLFVSTGNRDACQPSAAIECPIADAHHAVWNRDA